MGSKFGGGGVAGASETNVDRRERLRKLALETIDLAKVRIPFFNIKFLAPLISRRIPTFYATISDLSNVGYV